MVVKTALPISFTLDELFLLRNAVGTKVGLHLMGAEKGGPNADSHRELAGQYGAVLDKVIASFEDHGWTVD